MAKLKHTGKSMTEAQKVKYYKEFEKAKKEGLSKWEAIKWARRVAFYNI